MRRKETSSMTEVALELPDDVARQLGSRGRDLSRRALEALALDGYCAGELSTAQVQRMLGLASRWDVEMFLAERRAHLPYTEADLKADLEAVGRLSEP
jgi:hypothetical protein